MAAELSSAHQGWRTTTRVVLVLLAVALVVVAVTGVWLWFRYVPSASTGWPGTRAPATDESWIRTTHRLVSFLVVALAVAALVLVIGRRVRSGVRGIVAATGVLVTALAAAITGYLLPWDQLALWAVTVGSDIRGVQAPFRSEVKYILVGSHEVSPGTYRFWAVAHVVLGVLVMATLVLAWLRSRAHDASRRPLSPPPAGPPPGLEAQPVS